VRAPPSLAAGVAALAVLAGCKEREAPAPVVSASAAPEPAPLASARRPARRYYLTRTTAARCEITRVDEAGTSSPLVTACPLELNVGERIRIAGKTCVHESPDPARVEPTVCPDPLTNLEKKDLGLLR
jgi:hypothetical protein